MQDFTCAKKEPELRICTDWSLTEIEFLLEINFCPQHDALEMILKLGLKKDFQ
jgi:hypothetical protein